VEPQRTDIGLVVMGDQFEIVDGGGHLGRHGVALRGHLQQQLQQFDDRGDGCAGSMRNGD
jgi:hypothetical protein